jgi:hypothetical protein
LTTGGTILATAMLGLLCRIDQSHKKPPPVRARRRDVYF